MLQFGGDINNMAYNVYAVGYFYNPSVSLPNVTLTDSIIGGNQASTVQYKANYSVSGNTITFTFPKSLIDSTLSFNSTNSNIFLQSSVYAIYPSVSVNNLWGYGNTTYGAQYTPLSTSTYTITTQPIQNVATSFNSTTKSLIVTFDLSGCKVLQEYSKALWHIM